MPPCSPCGSRSHGVDWRGDKDSHWQVCPPPLRTRCSELANSLKMTHSLLRHVGFLTHLLTDGLKRGRTGGHSEIWTSIWFWNDWKDKVWHKSNQISRPLAGLSLLSIILLSCVRSYFSLLNKAMCRQNMHRLVGPFCILLNTSTLRTNEKTYECPKMSS